MATPVKLRYLPQCVQTVQERFLGHLGRLWFAGTGCSANMNGVPVAGLMALLAAFGPIWKSVQLHSRSCNSKEEHCDEAS